MNVQKGFAVLALALVGLSASSSFASARCLGEAQIVAKVLSTEAVSSNKCLAKVQVSQLAENPTCAAILTEQDIEAAGILIPADNTQCLQGVGAELRTIVELKADGSIAQVR